MGEFVTRLIKQLDAINAQIAVPVLREGEEPEAEDIFSDFSSGYFQRSKNLLPKNAASLPWRLNQEYVVDRKRMKSDPVDDGILVVYRHDANARAVEEQLEAAE